MQIHKYKFTGNMSPGLCCESEASNIQMGLEVIYPGLSFPSNCLFNFIYIFHVSMHLWNINNDYYISCVKMMVPFLIFTFSSI